MTLAARLHGRRLTTRLWPFRHREEVATVIDMGSHKIACAILLLNAPASYAGGVTPGAGFKVIGSAVLRSAGLSGGRIVNMTAAETCLRRAVAKAEAEAGTAASEVAVTGAFAGLAADIFDVTIEGEEDARGDEMATIRSATGDHCLSQQRQLLHLFSAGRHPPDPQTNAQTFEIAAVSAPGRGLRQLSACVKRSLLSPGVYIAGPIAAALAISRPDERQRGIAIVDIGAHATGIVLFSGGLPLFAETLATGGRLITDALAKAFSLRKFDAERLKVKHGSVFEGLQADIDLPYVDGETGEAISKFATAHIARTQMRSLFEAVNEGLSRSGYPLPVLGVVLTGGGSLLPGMRELASQCLGCPVRIGEPARNSGMDVDATLSALIGACYYAGGHRSEMEADESNGHPSAGTGYASRIGQWLREGF